VNRAGAVSKGLLALVALAALVACVPWALWHYIGWPLPHHLPSWSQFTTGLSQHGIANTTLLKALACVVWLAWAILVASVVVELDAAIRGRSARRVAVIGRLQPVVGQLLAAIVVAAIALAPRPVAAPRPLAAAVATGRRPAAVAAVALLANPNPDPTPIASPPAPGASGEQLQTYVVQRNDTLWGIAERELGDPLRWTDIYALNAGRPEPGGAVLDDPNWIYPGWTLLLPASATPQASIAAPAAPAPAPSPSPPSMPGPATSPAPISPPATAVPPPTTTPATPAPATPAPATSVPHTNGTIPDSGAHNGLPVRLPSGSVIAGSFAAGVLSAVAAGRLRRRRAYRPSPPRPGVRPAAPGHPAGLHDLLVTVGADRRDRDGDLNRAAAPDRAPLGVLPDDEAIARPDLIEVGHRGDETVSLALGDWPGLRLSGPGAEPALRAWLATLVTRDGPYAAEILVAGDSLFERLLPDVSLPSVRQLETVDSLLSWLEAAALRRARRLEEADAPDANAYRRQCPADPFPLLLGLVDGVPDGVKSRWSAAMTTARRVGVAAVVLADRLDNVLAAGPAGPRLVVAEDGVVEQASLVALADVLVGGSLFQLDRATAADLLRPVAAVHNDIDPEPSPDPAVDASDTGGDAPGTPRALPPEPEGVDAIPGRPAGVVGMREPAPIRVRLFGPAYVEAFGEEIKSGLRASAYELLAWYAEHPGGASIEVAADAIWPDASARRGRERFWTALGNLRSRLHGPSNDAVEILVKAGDCYRPDPAVLDIDLWEFEAALREATRAADSAQAAAALQVAIDAYGGDFCPALDAMWVEPVREDAHRRALDAHLRLAELYADDQPEAALDVLERAVQADPICEEGYRRLITLQVKLHRRDSAQRTWRLLQGRLAELDLEPEEATEQLVHELFPPRPTTTRHLPPTRR
jgi:DNA-binding SARP family transcriptional activator